nr:matrix protein [Hipposideros bat coronavirus]
MTDANITQEELVTHLKNWNFSWNIILTIFIVILQFGHYKYSRIFYGLKMLILWLLWPLVLALSIFDTWANWGSNWAFVAFSLFMAVSTLIMWVMYFVNSFRLFRRARTFWAWNPEVNAITVTTVLGQTYYQPIQQAPTGITVTLLSGVLYVDGHRLASGVQVHNLPEYMSVAVPNTTIIYSRVGRSVNSRNSTGWVFYVRVKHGDFSAVSSPTSNMTENERLLHLI